MAQTEALIQQECPICKTGCESKGLQSRISPASNQLRSSKGDSQIVPGSQSAMCEIRTQRAVDLLLLLRAAGSLPVVELGGDQLTTERRLT